MSKAKSPQAWYGWRPDLPDQHDFKFSVTHPGVPVEQLPDTVDLRPNCSPIEDQGALGSCTANALVGALEYLERNGDPANHVQPDATPTNLSRLFVYYNERAMEGTVNEDSGAYIRDGVKCLNKFGVCPESLVPYNIGKFTRKPTPTAYKRALSHRINLYSRLSTEADMLNCLAVGFPFVFGFTVYESFESEAVASVGEVPMPAPDEQVLGGHAVLCVGYNRSNQMFTVRNSWGKDWGDHGYFYMPFAYLTDRNLSDDLWSIRR
jgi:C1A family cysteine protease